MDDVQLEAGRYQVTLTLASACCISMFLHSPLGEELPFNEIFDVEGRGGTVVNTYEVTEAGAHFIDSQKYEIGARGDRAAFAGGAAKRFPCVRCRSCCASSRPSRIRLLSRFTCAVASDLASRALHWIGSRQRVQKLGRARKVRASIFGVSREELDAAYPLRIVSPRQPRGPRRPFCLPVKTCPNGNIEVVRTWVSKQHCGRSRTSRELRVHRH